MASRKFDYYPYYTEEKFFEKIYHKKEYYINRQKWINPDDPPKFDEICREDKEFELLPQQRLLKNYINPQTPYHNLLIFHETGVGKSLSALSISESSREYFKKLRLTTPNRNPLIYIIASRGAENNFIRELINRFDYYASKEERQRLERLFQEGRLEEYEAFLKELKERLSNPDKGGFYRFIGYKKFQNQTIGARFRNVEKKLIRDVEGGIQRRQIGKPIENLDDCILIIDEAHNIEANDYGEAVENIISKSKNLRVILLTATPMKLRAVEIVQLMNFILPKDKKLKRDKYFDKNGTVREDRLDEFKAKIKGYVSFLRSQPYSFPKRIDEGQLLPGFKYTKLIPCPMSPLHYATYKAEYDGKNTPESKKLMDMVLPNPNPNSKIGIYKTEDINNLIGNASPVWLEKEKIVPLNEKNNTIISGEILSEENLKKYSTKFYKLLKNLKATLKPDYGAIFVYDEQIVGIGLKMLKQMLKENGFDEYNDKVSPEVNLKHHLDNLSLCVFCGLTYAQHKKGEGQEHPFYSAKVAVLTGETDINVRGQLINVINDYTNKDGRYIKIILGSAPARESIDFKRIREVHILNFNEDISTTEQIIGRAIRHCSHIGLPAKDRNVRIFRYVASLPSSSELSGEELRYLNAEKEHIEIKKIERALKEGAFDCALNKFGNIFEEEVEKYRHPPYPASCDYQPCQYKCSWEPPTIASNGFLVKKFKELTLRDLDLDTYNVNLANREIKAIKETLKNIFRRNLVLKIDDILKMVKQDIVGFERDLLQERFIFIALQEMMKSGQDWFLNQFGIQGYIAYRGGYYVFQPSGLVNPGVNLLDRLKPVENVDEPGVSVREFLDLEKPIKDQSLDKLIIEINEKGISDEFMERVPKNKQIGLLEEAIMNQKDKKYKTILEYYKPYIITRRDLDRASYSSGDTFSEEYVGHLLAQQPKCLTLEQIWETCEIDYIKLNERLKNQKENDIIIGFIDKNKNNQFVFKLRPPLHNGMYHKDKRTIEQGFVCNRTSDKNKILEIAKKLGVKISSKAPIRQICQGIEENLKARDNEAIELVKKKGKSEEKVIRWFYSYLEVLAQKSQT